MQFHSPARNAAAILAVSTLFGLSSVSVSAQQSTAKLDDPTIVAIFDAANTYDMETGSLAARKGNSSEVREFGAMIARDHENVRTQGRELAKSLHVTPTPPANFALATAHADAMK